MAAALLLAAAPAFAQTFTQTVFFGDSLTDAGYFRPLLPASVRAVTGQFTTNPGYVWAQHVADYYGTTASANGNGQTGTNYAAGGARVGVNSTGALGPIPSLATQVNNYLTATGGRADAGALYTVWGGANDLFAITNAGADPQTTIAAAVGAEIGIVARLTGAGAQYILVPTVPDLGATPAFRAQGPGAQASGTALSTSYNNALFGGLASNGLRVIPIDTFNLLREIMASPGTYGFTNITGTACQPQITANSLTCNPTSLVTPDAPNTYLFADGVHPTTRTHQMLSQYVVSVIEGPRQMALLPNAASVVGRARAERVAAQLVPAEADGMRWWADVRGDFQRYGEGDTYDGAGPTLSVGANWTRGNVVFGAFGGYGQQAQDWGRSGGSFDQSDASLGGFIGWKADGGLWANAQASYTQLGFDTDRDVVLGPVTRTHSASVDGSNISFGASAGWEFGEGSLRHGPVIAVLSQKIEIDAFAENDAALSTSLAYPEQSFDSLIGSAGWQVSGTIHEHLKPYARVTWDKEFEDAPAQAFAQLQSMPNTLPYAVPGHSFDQSYGTLTFGARTQLLGMDANVGTSLTVGQEGGNHATVFASVGMGF
ncbi:esterase [Lysobacter daejeonensis GH1-9]|uniref:Esterase n=1 Tax=Lysobacter daejeonensis GH1-9 TaxID=1385517 RepID=A0A0A0EW97_9GAMM|nr:autotransporter domain-containing protein [Lysobacter daejeonensis]KGM55256.1 esterase [Lysobacter daejeonensis GH1-9]